VIQALQQNDCDPALLANAIRALTIDAVEKVNSGHLGMPMAWRRSPSRCGGATSNTTLVLPGRVPRLAIEAGVSDYWRKYVGLSGEVIGIDTFGESSPADTRAEGIVNQKAGSV
jgi:transketolase